MDSYTWLLVDGKNLAMRYFATHKHLHVLRDGLLLQTGLTHGFMHHLCLLKRRFEGRIAVCWDRGRERREKIFPDYKKSRDEKIWEDEGLYRDHFAVLREVLKLTGCRQMAKKGEEADDLVYTLALRLEGTKLIVSNDHDFFQLLRLGDTHQVLNRKKKQVIMDVDRLKVEHGCSPKEYFEAVCLAGDRGDSIPGLPRVGIKTALKMIRGEKPKPEGWQEVERRNRALVRLYDVHPVTVSRFKLRKGRLADTLAHYELDCLLDKVHWLEALGE